MLASTFLVVWQEHQMLIKEHQGAHEHQVVGGLLVSTDEYHVDSEWVNK